MSLLGEKFQESRWNKSSYSTNSVGCVEVALTSGATGVRDSKDPDGGTLVVSSQQWKSFVDSVKQ